MFCCAATSAKWSQWEDGLHPHHASNITLHRRMPLPKHPLHTSFCANIKPCVHKHGTNLQETSTGCSVPSSIELISHEKKWHIYNVHQIDTRLPNGFQGASYHTNLPCHSCGVKCIRMHNLTNDNEDSTTIQALCYVQLGPSVGYLLWGIQSYRQWPHTMQYACTMSDSIDRVTKLIKWHKITYSVSLPSKLTLIKVYKPKRHRWLCTILSICFFLAKTNITCYPETTNF